MIQFTNDIRAYSVTTSGSVSASLEIARWGHKRFFIDPSQISLQLIAEYVLTGSRERRQLKALR
jgi:hypothetical protein